METDLNQERQEAHALLDLLPPDKLNAVRSLLEVMVEPLARLLALAEVEQEEITSETEAALDRGRASLACGEGISHDEILREFRIEAVSEESAPERIAIIWSPEARADVRVIERDNAMQILHCPRSWIDRSSTLRTCPADKISL